jgi:hypothetical protein
MESVIFDLWRSANELDSAKVYQPANIEWAAFGAQKNSR